MAAGEEKWGKETFREFGISRYTLLFKIGLYCIVPIV